MNTDEAKPEPDGSFDPLKAAEAAAKRAELRTLVVRQIVLTVAAIAAIAVVVVVIHLLRPPYRYTETSVPALFGYHGRVYFWVDELPVRSGVPHGLTRAGTGYPLNGNWPNGPLFAEPGNDEPAFTIAGKPTRIASPNSWGGGFTHYNVYDLVQGATWQFQQ